MRRHKSDVRSYDECKRKYNISIYRLFIDLFSHIPLGTLVDEEMLDDFERV